MRSPYSILAYPPFSPGAGENVFQPQLELSEGIASFILYGNTENFIRRLWIGAGCFHNGFVRGRGHGFRMNYHRFWIGERMGPWGWIGAGCILAGILMAEAVKRAQGKEQGA
jgi:hypothetical protein